MRAGEERASSRHWPERMKTDMNRKYASKDLKCDI